MTRWSGRGHCLGMVQTWARHYSLSPRRVCLSAVTCSLTTAPPPVGGGPAGSNQRWPLTGAPRRFWLHQGSSVEGTRGHLCRVPFYHAPACGRLCSCDTRRAQHWEGHACHCHGVSLAIVSGPAAQTVGLHSEHLEPLSIGGGGLSSGASVLDPVKQEPMHCGQRQDQGGASCEDMGGASCHGLRVSLRPHPLWRRT